MSDGVLSRVPTLTAPVSIKDERGEHRAVTNAIAWVKKEDVLAALRDPHPVELRPAAAALFQALDVGRFDLLPPAQQTRWMDAARAVSIALAGGDE